MAHTFSSGLGSAANHCRQCSVGGEGLADTVTFTFGDAVVGLWLPFLVGAIVAALLTLLRGDPE